MSKEKGTGAAAEAAVDVEKLKAEIKAELLKEVEINKANIKAELRAEIEAEIRAEAKEDENTMGAAVAEMVEQKRFKIVINEQENTDTQGGNNDVFVSCNGIPFLIKRGREVVIPEGHLNVLKESRPISIKKNEDEELVLREYPRFALQIIGEVAEGAAK